MAWRLTKVHAIFPSTRLPMSKLYAAHYGGALTLASADGGAVATLEPPPTDDRPEAARGAGRQEHTVLRPALISVLYRE